MIYCLQTDNTCVDYCPDAGWHLSHSTEHLVNKANPQQMSLVDHIKIIYSKQFYESKERTESSTSFFLIYIFFKFG